MDERAVAEEQMKLARRSKAETLVRLLQRALNHETLTDGEYEEIADCCNWVWQWAANREE